MSDPQDVLRRVYAQLATLGSNPPPIPDEDDVARYHALLDQLAGLGYNLDDFRFDMQRDLYRRWTSSNYLTGETTYADKRNVRPDIFKNKVDALLLYFRLDGGPVAGKEPGSARKKAQIGFDAPRNSGR